MLDDSFFWFIDNTVPTQEYVVTVKLKQLNPAYPKSFDMCQIGDSGSCSDEKGRHHSFIVMCRSAFEACQVADSYFGPKVHITRVENAMTLTTEGWI